MKNRNRNPWSLLPTSHFLLLTCPFNLEGKKGNLEGTWRAVVGHLEGDDEIVQSLAQSRFTGNLSLTWREFGKSIYKRKTSEKWEVGSEK